MLTRFACSLLLVLAATAAKASAEVECREGIEAVRAELSANPRGPAWKKRTTIIWTTERHLAAGEYDACATVFREIREAREESNR
jgi:hypothetical protein